MAARRPRLFSFGRDIELQTIDGWATPEERPLLVAVIDAFLEVTRTRQLTPDRLRPVVTASRHPSANVRALAVSRLVVMAHYFEHARAAYRDLALAEQPGVRETACGALANAPDDLFIGLLEIHLADEAVPVRRAAARLAASHADEALLPIVERALAKEEDAFTATLLGRAHGFLEGAVGH
jgi:HEAT repeat protein